MILGGLPIAIGIWAVLGNLNRLLPGTMGVALGRNPNGAVRDISARYGILLDAPVVLVALLASLALVAVLAVTGAITGWGLLFGSAIAMVAWPQLAEILVARRSPKSHHGGLEWAGIDAPLTDDDLRRVEAALRLDGVSA